MIYEIINPSDPYTMVAESDLVAALATMLLGEGYYGLREGNRAVDCPLLAFGGGESDLEAWSQRVGGLPFGELLNLHKPEIAKALGSVLVGSPANREIYEAAVSRMTAEDALRFWEIWDDKKRSSLNEIGARALAMSKSLTRKAEGQG